MTEKRSRSHSFHLRLSDEEYEKLQREAKMAGLKPQTNIHKVLKGHQITERAPIDLIETVRKLNRIDINLNQLAWGAHSLNFIDTKAYWENVEMVQDVILRLLEGYQRQRSQER